MLNIGSYEFELDKIYPYNIPQDFAEPSKEIIAECRKLLKADGLPDIDKKFEWTWFLHNSKLGGSGNLTKRIGKYYYKKHEKMLVNPVTLSKIGKLVTENTLKDKTVYFDLDTKLNWKPGSFGEPTASCFWGNRCGARYYIMDNKGGAFRIYADEKMSKGLARCWWLPLNGNLILFNEYGWPLYSMARMLATYSGLTYMKTTFKDPNKILYLNHTEGCYMVGPQGELSDMCELPIVFDALEYKRYSKCTYCNLYKPGNRMHYMNYDEHRGICIECNNKNVEEQEEE